MNLGSIQKKWIVGLSAILIAAIAIGFRPNSADDLDLPKKVDFNYHIRPILSQNCFVCHGPDSSSRKASLRFDISEGATIKLEHGGSAIVPGYPGKSLLLARISSDDPEFRMPPPEAKKILSAREIALLRKWIRQGAKWDAHWAFMPAQMPELHTAMRKASTSETIDHLVDKKLKSKQIKPSLSASRNALIRRVSYILTGLPPKPEDVHVFISDASADAYEKMVDRYFSSPHFGERWARHWMDLVRYGEYMGHEYDYAIGGAYNYRDYLIRAFNQDVPYDQFVKEHLAGDMLTEPRYHPEGGFNESILGTAYFFIGEGKHSPVEIKLEEADRIDNMIDVTSKTFQAMTVGCARCHDHKFDPIPTTDYYGMYGMIESARFGPIPARKTLKQEAQVTQLKELKKEIRSQLGTHFQKVLESLSRGPAPSVAEEESRDSSLQSLNKKREYIQNLQELSPVEDNEKFKVIGDFRKGSWEGWYSDGWAFGEAPIMGEPMIDEETAKVKGLRTGIASSRSISRGVQGALRSPNFIIEQDSIAVRAAGHNGLIRIIVENFQIIQYPLWGSLEKWIVDEEWKTYVLDVSRLQGRKAYIQFTPGHYGLFPKQSPQHTYRIKPEDYIEVEYAITFNGELLESYSDENNDQQNLAHGISKQSIDDWVSERAGTNQIRALDNWLKELNGITYSKPTADLLTTYGNIATQLYDSTYVIGFSEGDAVFSSVFIRGSVNNRSEEKVPRRFLSAIQAGPDTFPQHGSGRLAWAEAVVDPENPLTSRVIVNRIWHHLFGKGIVETVDNFGLQGKLPSHPELLDYLALQMIEDGWSIKQMIKHILLSQTFQRSTSVMPENQKIDSENILLHHFPIRRLEAEAIRDGILAVAGSLNTEMYGKSVEIHLTEFMTGRGSPKDPGPLDGYGRRSVYMSIRRNFLSPMMLVFDMPIPFSTFGRRNTTNVPAQSLTLLNDPFVHDQACSWGERLSEQTNTSVTEKIHKIYLTAFSRKASEKELEEAKTVLEDLAQNYDSILEEMKDDALLWTDYCQTIFNLKEFIHLL